MGCARSRDLARLEARMDRVLLHLEDGEQEAPMQSAMSSRLKPITAALSKQSDAGSPVSSHKSLQSSASSSQRSRRQRWMLPRTEGYDVFVSHAKRLPESEDRAVWVADVVEGHGLRSFFDRSDLIEITEPALQEAMLLTDVCVIVLDPFTFDSKWVFMEILLAANSGIPIVAVYDADRFRFAGQLDKWLKLYPWVFQRQVVPITKSERRKSTEALLEAILAAQAGGRRPPLDPIETTMGGCVDVRVGVGGSRETDTRGAIETAYKTMLSRIGGKPSLMVCAFTCTHDATLVAERLGALALSVPFIGCTSCRGIVVNDTWLTHNMEYAVAVWGISDDAGAYATVHITERSPNLSDAVFREVTRACGLRGDSPSFAVLLGSPGDEENILNAMQKALGPNTPILGGSSADNGVLGEWRQIAKVGSSYLQTADPTISPNGVAIAVAWASCKIASVLTSGFRETACRGKVTKVDSADNGRTIFEIDGRPIKTVYEEWSKGASTRDVEWKDDVATVLAPSSFCPLGEPCGDGYFRVMHPAFLNRKSGALTTFADACEGMDIVMLDASPETMAKNISQSARKLILDKMDSGRRKSFAASDIATENIIGALSIFCGGLVMAIDKQMPMAVEQLSEVLGHNNVMGICCFGEQGMNHRGRATHGNLMFGCLLFSNQSRDEAASCLRESGAVESENISIEVADFGGQGVALLHETTGEDLDPRVVPATERAASRSYF